MALIEVAKILKPQGIKGEVKAQPLTNVLAVFKGLENAFVGGKECEIEHISCRQGFLYIKFDNVKTRNDAETLRNKTIALDKQLLEEFIEEDEILVDDLIGKVLYDENGQLVGQIVDVENYGATYNFIIEGDARTYQTPFVDGVFDKKTFTVNRHKFDEVSVW